jgi:heat shock protein 1/8
MTLLGLTTPAETTNKRNLLIFDLGVGTFDISLHCIEYCIFDVRINNGHIHLGGEDFDNNLVDFCVKEFRKKSKIDISINRDP